MMWEHLPTFGSILLEQWSGMKLEYSYLMIFLANIIFRSLPYWRRCGRRIRPVEEPELIHCSTY